MYKLFIAFKKYKNYKPTNLKKKMKPIITQYYIRKLYAGEIRHLADFITFVEKKYYLVFKSSLINHLYSIFIELIINSINN